MAFSDYNVLPHLNGSGTGWLGGDQGIEISHDSLTNPLTQQGTYCRSFQALHSTGFVTADKRYQWLLDPVEQPDFTHINDDKKVSIRMWVRRVGGANNMTVGIGFKTGEGPQNDEPRGYLFALGEGDFFALTNTNALHLRSVDGTGSQTYNSGDLSVITADTWVQLRMDVRPVFDGFNNVIGDEVTCYSNTSEGSPVWNLEDQQVFDDDINNPPGNGTFRPWWNSAGWEAFRDQFPSVGWHVYTSNTIGSDNDNNATNRAYISSLEIQVSSALDPWPALP